MDLIMRRGLMQLAGTGVVGTAMLIPLLSEPTTATATTATVPPIRHVFVIVLENQSSSATFGNPTADPYLATTLPSLGAYLPNYYATGHASNDNYISMVSGQAPNPQNQGDCLLYDQFVGLGPLVSGTGTLLDGQAIGTGCVYPTSVASIADQLNSAGNSWKGYMEDMGNVPTRESAVCGHPAINGLDGTQGAVSGDGYATRHNPFAYFQSIIGNQTYCGSHIVPLGSTSGVLPPSAPVGTTGLVADLGSVSTTPNLSYIVPNLCNDGHDFPCTNEQAPSSSAVGDIDLFLKTWVPKILASPAYLQDGLLVITFDEGAISDTASCCNEMPGPVSPLPGITGQGGGKIGALLLSPFIKGGTMPTTSYNHYGLLASIEDLFSLPRLGFAADVPATFGRDVYTNF
jgi:hypothetical protein